MPLHRTWRGPQIILKKIISGQVATELAVRRGERGRILTATRGNWEVIGMLNACSKDSEIIALFNVRRIVCLSTY